jgi:hypothetical protein
MNLHWWAAPLAGDIVWCYFPEDLGVEPAQKPRPGLVLEVYDDSAPEYVVLLAYGTSQKISPLYSGEFSITPQDGTAYKVAGLSYPTKFNLRKRIQLPFRSDYFDVAPGAPFGQQPKLGQLHASLVRRVAAAWKAASTDE